MNKLTKRLLSLLVVAVLVATMLPTVFAEEPVYTDWDGSAAAIVAGAYLKLTGDKDITAVYNIDGIAVTIDLNGNTIESTEDTRAFYVKNGGSLTLKNGFITMPGVSASSGGMIYVDKSTFNMDNVVITKSGFTATNTANGGILYLIGNTTKVEIENSTLAWDATSTGSVTQGGNVYITSAAEVTMRNTTISGGNSTYGAGIFATSSNTKLHLYGTTINSGAAYRGCGLYIGNANAITNIYAGSVITNGTFVAGSATNYGQAVFAQGEFTVSGGTFGDIYDKNGTVSIASGVSFYNNPAIAGYKGFEAYVMDKSTSQTKYTVYADFDDAMAAAEAIATPTTTTVSLMDDVTADEVIVPAGVTLNLYGKTLTANAVNSTANGAQIKDEKSSKNAGGKLVCDSVAVSADNVFAPINYGGAYHFQKFAVAENLSDNLYKFYFSDDVETILLDELWANGSEGTGVKLEVYVTGIQGGVEKSKTFVCSSDLIAQYAADWENKMFTLTFGDISGIENLQCTARVVVG